MKKVNLFLVFIIISITVFGQDIIINFTGEGASTEVTTVEVVNLSNCTNIEVPGGSSLNLNTGTITGIKEFKNSENNTISSYPNPFNNSTNIEFNVNQNDYITITVCDISGKIVADNSREMTAGIHSYEFTANSLGMYFINISGTNFIQCSKVICLSNNSQQAKLIYNEQVAERISEKSYKSDNSKDFSFTVGDMLKLKGISGDYNYATIMVVEPTVSETYIFNFKTCQDGDNNNYAVVVIGKQTWMAENIKTTSYTRGENIPLVEDYTEWSNLENSNTDKAYCFYNNNSESIYGALYTYAAATDGTPGNTKKKVQGVCPENWHLPDNTEWTTLTDELISDPGGKLKSVCMSLWRSPNTGATNETGFSALPGGYRNQNTGDFTTETYHGIWWSSIEDCGPHAWYRRLDSDNTGVYQSAADKSLGISVRCVMD